MKPHSTYKTWIQKERNGFWVNTETGESSIWHPQVIEIAGPLYAKASAWCRKASDDRNKRTKKR